MSRPSEPVGTVGMSSWRLWPSLRRMIAPLPYSFSTLAMASSRAAFFCLSFLSSLMGMPPRIGPRTSPDHRVEGLPLEPRSHVEKKGLVVQGYAGDRAENHISHLMEMAATALPKLAAR